MRQADDGQARQPTVATRTSTLLSRASWWLVVGFSLALPAALHVAGAAWEWVLAGAAAYAVSLPLKGLLATCVRSVLKERSPRWRATESGLVSAVAELGMAALALWAIGPAAGAAVGWLAVALGAGCADNLFLASEAMVEPGRASDVPSWRALAFAIERLGFALPLHVASRGLIAIAIATGHSAPAVPAVVVFALIDGLSDYGTRVGWNYSDPRVLARYYLVTGALAWSLAGALVYALGQ